MFKKLYKLESEYEKTYMRSQVNMLVVIGIVCLAYSLIAYAFMADITWGFEHHGHSIYKALAMVSAFGVLYMCFGFRFVKREKQIRFFHAGTLLAALLYMLWADQAIYYSMIEVRNVNLLLWLMVMALIVSFINFRAHEFLVFWLVNVIYAVTLISATSHVSMGRGTIIDTAVFSTTLAVIYYGRYFTALASFRDKMAKEEAEETRNLFAASMNHELRSPLNSIIGNTQILLMNENILPETRENLEYIYESSNNMVQLVNDMLDFSRLEAGEFKIIPAEFSLLNLKKNMYNMYTNAMEAKGLKYRVHLEPGAELDLIGDFRRVQQVLVNLVSNSLKYTPAGKVTVNIDARGGLLTMQVQDTGSGMGEDTIKDLFEPFKRIDEERNRNIQGTGLGMFVVKSLVEQMNGTIEVTSVLGEGSKFLVKLPLTAVEGTGHYVRATGAKAEPQVADKNLQEDMDQEEEEQRDKDSGYDFTGKKVLSVDDTVMNNRIIQSLLQDTGAEVFCMMDAERCLKYLEKHTADLILLDHLMPGMDGLECLRRIRTGSPETKDIPVIMVTGNGGPQYEVMYKENGANGYITKPIMHDALLKVIKENIG